MRGRKKTSNHRRIKRRTVRSRKHQTRRKTLKKRGAARPPIKALEQTSRRSSEEERLKTRLLHHDSKGPN